MRLTDDQIKMARITYTKVVQDDFILDLIDTIEALQQENEQLKEQINTSEIGWDSYKTYLEQLEQQTVELLRKAREAIMAAWSGECSANKALDKASEALKLIDKVIGGKEDVGKK